MEYCTSKTLTTHPPAKLSAAAPSEGPSGHTCPDTTQHSNVIRSQGADSREGLRMDSTATVRRRPTFQSRAVIAVLRAFLAFSLGSAVFLFVPVLGWICGPMLMLWSVIEILKMFSKAPSYSGTCPYCGNPVGAGRPGAVRKCIRCKNRFVHRDDRLWRTA